MTVTFDDLLNQILSTNSKISRDELVSMVALKKQESHGLLSDEGAIRILAQQLSGISFPTLDLKDQRIASVHAGLNDTTVTGHVISVGTVREFQRSDGSPGRVLKIRVGDESGQISCVFWDSMVDNVAGERLASGSRVRLLHGYTKFGMAGEVEFHLGSRATLQVLSGGESSDLAGPNTLAAVSQKLGASDNIQVRLLKLQRSQSENGPTWALCVNDSGLVTAKFWDEHAKNILSVGEGSSVSIENPWVTERNGLVYVNVGSKSLVRKESREFVFETPVSSIKTLKPAPVLWCISGKVVEKSDVRDIETREGRRTRVSNINLEDSTGKLRVSLWDVHAEKAEGLRIGDSVRLIGIKVRQNLNGEIEASTVFLTQLEKLSQ